MARSQEALGEASTRIREVLLPAGRLIENAKREIDLQVHELNLLSTFNNQRRDLDPQQRTLLRLSPSVQSLLNLHASPLFPSALSQLFQPWTLAARAYQQRVPAFQSFDDASAALVDLRTKTHILQRAVDRELSVQLIRVTESSEKNMGYWALALALAFVASTAFAYLVWKWMEPLTILRAHFKDNKDGPFPSFAERGLSTPPSEVFDLLEILRAHAYASLRHKAELSEREAKMQDADRSLSTLFAAIAHLLRHNENLIAELVKKERLASMSEMAAELAHEIRNPLNSMSLKLELLREDLRDEDKKVLDRVLDEIDRLDALTESHLSQTRGGLRGQMPVLMTEQGESPVPQLFEEIRELHAPSLGEKQIRLEVSSVEGFSLPVPKSVMKSALVNLLKNSEEALEGNADTRGKTIRLEQVVEDGKDGASWKLRLLDTGCGFPREYKDNPFQIFRTSKAKGSGLGLVTTKKMLEAYGVRMRLESCSDPFVTCWCLEPASEAASNPSEPKETNL
jgi:signal transduction histidine kinase